MSGRKFSVGDRVVVVWAVPQFSQYVGAVGVILEVIGPDEYVTDIISPNGLGFRGYGRNFKPLYDGNQLASWSDCVWQPKRLTEDQPTTFLRPQHAPEDPHYG